MAHQDLRLLGSALALHRFTHIELARAANTNQNTARSWVQRNKAYLIAEGQVASGGRGRPSRVWRVAPDAVKTMRQRLDDIDFGERERQVSGEDSLAELRAQFETWKLSKRLAYSTEEVELLTLRRLIRLAWEDHSKVFLATQCDSITKNLRDIAEIERDAGFGAMPATDNLKSFAIWITESFARVSARANSDEFASRVLRLRSDVRSRADQAKMTAAALAAPVWSDEGLVESGASLVGLRSCALIAEVTAVSRVLDELADAIGKGKRKFCRDGEEAQAVVCGLASRTHFRRMAEVPRWMFSLLASNCWRLELAPVALHTLWEARDMHQGLLLEIMRDQIAEALMVQPEKVGRLRRRPLEFARRALGSGGPRKTGKPNELPVGLSAFYSYRPDKEAVEN